MNIHISIKELPNGKVAVGVNRLPGFGTTEEHKFADVLHAALRDVLIPSLIKNMGNTLEYSGPMPPPPQPPDGKGN